MPSTTTFALRMLVATILLLLPVRVAPAHTANPLAERIINHGYVGERHAVGSERAHEAVQLMAMLAAQIHNDFDQWLLPPTTVVDATRWNGNVLEIELTLPPVRGQWFLSPVDMGTLSVAFARPFMEDPAFGGTRIRARTDVREAYDTLAQFGLPEAPVGLSAPSPDPAFPIDGRPLLPTDEDDFGGPRGPITQAAQQPAGALSNVVVFAAAGHGWSAGSQNWVLQRPVLLEMAEDYGNLDQLNLFAQYVFNAGGVVVPLRPIGWQSLEVVLDNDDPGVVFTGAWVNGVSSKYYENGVTLSGVVYQAIAASAVETATARYTPVIPVSDFYPVYCFTIAGANRTVQTYRIRHSGGISEVKIDHRRVGNGWIWLGDYYLEAGSENYVEITNQSDIGGAIIADAIRWGSGTGDIVRPGPGSVSGFPRDEEAQRYWAESELGFNAVGFDSDIWDVVGIDDISDNVRTGAKWAREMNVTPEGGVLVNRWQRIYLEFHTNAFNGGARGQITLLTDLGGTTYAPEYATILSNEVDAHMNFLSSTFEHAWVDRPSPTLTGTYGAIAAAANGDQFDATIVELAFHDNPQDAELLRDPKVREAMARACVHGIIRFLHTLPGSQVPLVFAPDRPRSVRAVQLPNGNVRLSWDTPLTDAARGGPATGYVVYQSTNGYGFGNPIVLGNVLTTEITDLAAGETRFFRLAARNAGGESMPSELLAVRRPPANDPRILIVNGFDRSDRHTTPRQSFAQPSAYAGLFVERQVWRRTNAFDYVIEHAAALAASGYGFDSCSNDAIINSQILLGDYDIVVWMLGTESTAGATFNANERTKVTQFLGNGGALFVSGADLGFDLIGSGNGTSFAQNTLQINYVSNTAASTVAVPTGDGIFAGLAPVDFGLAAGAPYAVRSPDVLGPRPDSRTCLTYASGGAAGVQYTGTVYNVVSFGFPFETIGDATLRAEYMARIVEFLATAAGPLPFDFNRDGYVDWQDFQIFLFCFRGPNLVYPPGQICLEMDGDGDFDVDLADYALMQQVFTGPPQP